MQQASCLLSDRGQSENIQNATKRAIKRKEVLLMSKRNSQTIPYSKNYRPFTAIVDCEFGRRVIYTDETKIDATNIVSELQSALSDHRFNQQAIAYLDRYYRGDQPILYRKDKKARPEINEKVVENHAYELVESKVADLFGEPVQYVLKDTDDDSKASQLQQLNKMMESEDKADADIDKGRWASICGTSYLFVGKENRLPKMFDETPFFFKVENPYNTFVVYYSDDETPAFSCQIREDKQGTYYFCYTNGEFFKIRGNDIEEQGINGNAMIPVIEYPNNRRRLSDIEITITLTDEMNKMQSDRMNSIDQFVQAFLLFKNCEIDEETFKQLRDAGALSVKDSADGKSSDVRMISSELNQQQTQVSKDDIYQNFLIIQGKPGRQENSGGDTGQAVALRNGYYDEDKRAELRIPCFKKAERLMLRVVLNKLRITNGFNLSISDIEIKPKRSKLENMMVKAQVLQILHQIGIDDAIAIKTVNLFSDVQEVTNASIERMKEQFEAANNLGKQEDTSISLEDNNAKTNAII